MIIPERFIWDNPLPPFNLCTYYAFQFYRESLAYSTKSASFMGEPIQNWNRFLK